MRAIPLAMALLLAACQPVSTDAGSPPQPAAPSPAAVPDAASFDLTDPLWIVTDFGALMYAPRDSGDIHADMSCQPNGKISIWAPNSAEDGEKLLLVSGNESETFPASRIPADDEGFEGVASRIVIDASNQVLAAFRKSGQLSRGDPPDVMNAKSQKEMEAIESFFADCKVSPS